MGLVIILALGLYFLIAMGVVAGAVKYAKQHGKSVKRWGLGAAVVMFLIPFWDWLPTVAAHKYYCATEAGFWVYKTPEQWKQENPGVMETLVANKVSIQRVGDVENYNFTDTVVRNQRFSSVNQIQSPIFLLTVYSSKNEIIDLEKGEVLVRYVDFSSGKGRDYLKFWNNIQGCDTGTKNRIYFLEFSEQLEKMIATAKRSTK